MGILDGLLGMFGGQQQPQGGLLGSGGSNSLYGDLLTPQQQQALQNRAQQGGLLSLANSGALDYTVPFISGKVPGGFAKGVAAYAGGMGEGEDKGILNALNAQLAGLKGLDLKSQLAIRQKLLGILPGLLGGDSTAIPSTSGPSTASPLGDGLLSAPADTGEGSPSDPRGLVPYIKLTAQKYGVDPDLAVKVAASEGLGTFLGDGGKSGGAFQLYTGGGEGNNFQKETGLDPLDPKNERATIDFALRRVAEGGWGPWSGAKAQGITGMMGVDPSKALGTAPQRSLAGTAAAVGDLQPGLLAGPQDTVAPQVTGAGAQVTQAQLGGQPGLLSPPAQAASPIAMPQQPTMPFSGSQPSGALNNGVDPRRLAIGGVLAQLGGIGDVMKPMESYYYQSPGYLGQAEAAKAGAQFRAGKLPEIQAQTQADITKAGPIASAQQQAKVGPDLTIARGTQEAIGGREKDVKAFEAGLQPLQQRNEVLKGEYEKNVVEPFNAAQKALQPLSQIENAMQNFQTGPSAQTKLGVLRAWQDLQRNVGIDPNSETAKSIASGEIINKSGTTLGFELARTLGSREAQNIVQQAIAANPGLANSPEGNRQLIGLIKQGLQRDIDKRAFVDDWFNKKLTFAGATEAFNKARPVESYVSQILPYKPATPADAARLPPGTIFVDPSGVRRQVPGAQ